MEVQLPKAGMVGRTARLALGVCLVVIALPVYFEAGSRYNLASLGLALGLVIFYTLLHLLISRYLTRLNRWIGAILAVTPVLLVWFFGQGGGLLFGEGEGGTAAITFLAVSFLVDFVRADAGCEVMALPGLIFGNRTHLPCLLLCPIDHAEAAGADASGTVR
jgi:hypothetical protein